VESPSCHGGRDIVWRRWRLSNVPPGVRCVVCWEGFFGFNHKIMIKVQESPPSIMVTKNLWSARVWVRDWLCKGKTHHPQCNLPKVAALLFDYFFQSRVSIRWSFLRLKADLSSWESLYLIRLNPDPSKVWILASHVLHLVSLIPEGVLYRVILHPTNIKVYIWILKKIGKRFLTCRPNSNG
jgi:hypothetical protein